MMKPPAKPPSHSTSPKIKYDVFLSFRGEDIRDGFLSHLIAAFHRKKINAFVDDKLERGHEIWESLVGAIEGSSMSMIIFSQNYASSRWCLQELVKILECREKYGQGVIPVFYHVDPTDVRHQTGSYKTAFAEHGEKYHPTAVQNWRDALHKSANLSGTKSSDSSNDDKLLEEIANLLLTRLSKHPFHSTGLIGIDEKVSHVESLLQQESKDAHIIGIWGMGGIGKTTTAQEVYNRLQSEYEGFYFLANEREESKRRGMISLKQKLFSALLGEDVEISTDYGLPDDINRRIGRMKVLVVLDDVNDSDHIEKLFGTPNCLGFGSKIIVTTRDKQVLIANNVVMIHQVEELSPIQALDLFNLNAFNQSHLKMEYCELSKRFVNYAGGIPLVLKVLGHLLRGKDKEVWKSQLSKLEKMPIKKVYDAMKLSYDDLDRKEKKIFLDLACFFVVLNLKVDYIKALLKDGTSDNSVAVGLERLKDMALINFVEHNAVSMHDIVQEMAWEIVREESNEDLGSYTRLWNQDDVYQVLKYDKGTECIRSMVARLSTFQISKLVLSPYSFTKMRNLQFLDIHSKHNVLPKGLQSLPNEIRYLHWESYPLKSLPGKFSAEKLVILDLSSSKMEKLWNGVQNVKNLKEVTLFYSKFLKELPDFSKAINLEVLDLSYCSQLSSVHPSVFTLDKLVKLNLELCSSLTELISNVHMRSLSYLNLSFCGSLREFSVTSETMIELNLERTKVEELPSLFGRQGKLEILRLGRSNIRRLPSCIKNLTRLRCLNVESCTELSIIPNVPPSLETLIANSCISLKTVWFPLTVAEQLKENRKRLEFWNCFRLDEQTLIAIGLNARINVMKFAHQHLSAAVEHECVENYDDYNDNYRSYQVMYSYPGSSVPEWLEYKTTQEDYIVIDLSSAPRSHKLGFIFCFVLENPASFSDKLAFVVTMSYDGEGEDDRVRIYISPTSTRSMCTDYVCVMYDQRCSRYLNSRARNYSRFKIKVTREAQNVKLKGFGMSLVSEFHSINGIVGL